MISIIYLVLINFICLMDTCLKYYLEPNTNIRIINTNAISLNCKITHNYGFSYGKLKLLGRYEKLALHIISLCTFSLICCVINNIYLYSVWFASLYNLYDRLIYGYIIDYINLQIFLLNCGVKFPVFNLPDLLIIVNICAYYLL